MNFESTFAAIPAIVIIVYLVAELFKVIFSNNTDANQYIPIICGATGLILGVLCYCFWPAVISGADNAISAAAIGTFSGLSATGVNQIWKQVTKSSTTNEETDENN